MIFLKIYLSGVGIAFIIELLSMIRLGDFKRWAWECAIVWSLFSWLDVASFVMWIWTMMGWDYSQDPQWVAWRLKDE